MHRVLILQPKITVEWKDQVGEENLKVRERMAHTKGPRNNVARNRGCRRQRQSTQAQGSRPIYSSETIGRGYGRKAVASIIEEATQAYHANNLNLVKKSNCRLGGGNSPGWGRIRDGPR